MQLHKWTAGDYLKFIAKKTDKKKMKNTRPDEKKFLLSKIFLFY